MRSLVIICTAFILSFAGNAYAAEPELTVTTGEPFTFGVETELDQPNYSWALTRNGQILSAQAERFFTYAISDESPYDLSVTITDANGGEKTYSFKVVPQPAIEVSPSDQSFVRAILRTEPPASGQDGEVTLPLHGGTMLLHMDESTGAIREYHVDTNTDSDSDGDGDSANDADNRSHPSFYAGGSFPVSIVPSVGEAEREIQLTVFGAQGEVSRTSIKVAFSAEVPLVPNLVTFPISSSQMGLITIPANGGIISFDASGSTGGVQRFSLDLDLDADSDGDGISDNDKDVSGTEFERSGKSITMFLKSIGGKRERRIALTVQRGDGQTSTVSRTIRFSGAMPDEPSDTSGSAVKIISDKNVIRVGESFTLTIQNPPDSASSFEWDLQSDGNIDSKTDEPSLLLEPDAPGILPVRVTIYDKSGSNISTVSSKYTVRTASDDEDSDDGMPDASPGKKELKIDVTTEGLGVSLKPVSGKGIDVASLSPTWEFGDGAKSYLLTPSHQYESSGSYEVSLFLFDMSSKREVASAKTEVIVEGVPVIPSGDGNGGALSAILSSVAAIFKIFIFVLLLLIVVGGIIGGGLFLFAKSRGVKFKDLFRGRQEIDSATASDAEPEENVSEIIEAASVPTEQLEETPEFAEPPPVKLEAEPEVEEGIVQSPESPKAEIKAEAAIPDIVEKTDPVPSVTGSEKSATDTTTTETPQPEPPKQAEITAPAAEKSPEPQTQESMPPWLQATQGEPVESPPPAPPKPTQAEKKPKDPVQKEAPAPNTPVSDGKVPNWLEHGMQKAEEKGQTQKTPPPVEISGSIPPDATSDVPPAPTPEKPKENQEALQNDDETIAIVEAELPKEEDEKNKSS